MSKLYTPLGDEISEQELEEVGRIECPFCHLAVIEDEFFPCPTCEANICPYCYEASTCPDRSRTGFDVDFGEDSDGHMEAEL